MMELELRKLQQVVNRLLDHAIHTRGIDKVKIGQNFYWDVDPDALYNMNQKPANLSVGSLHDDWGFVSSLLSDEKQPVVYQLTEVAPLLRYVGEVLGKELAKDGG